MNNLSAITILFVSIFLVSCAQTKLFNANNSQIVYGGRTEPGQPEGTVLVGSASYAEVRFKGDSCVALVKKTNKPGEPNFVSLEIDGQYSGRVKIDKEGILRIGIHPQAKLPVHTLRVFKATEAQTGDVVFAGVECKKITKTEPKPQRRIEFIGNSITCGMGVDWKEIPCHTGAWFEQHNAYLAYGPQAAMVLGAQFQLSSVSGIGIYRNWNSLHPVMPEVFENLHLDTNTAKRWDFKRFTPDLVSICLGTNDFSEGDKRNFRAPFDSATYVRAYIKFLETIYLHYPNTQICLLTSPMISGKNARLFENCLVAVKEHFKNIAPAKKEIALYFFEGLTPHGCDFHPDAEDQKKMAELLVPFYRKVMGW